MTPKMQDRENLNRVCRYQEIRGIGKTLEAGATRSTSNPAKVERCGADSLLNVLKFTHESLAETLALALVPLECRTEICLRLRI
jgi:hypothetical protein